jgi:hypothetical protein
VGSLVRLRSDGRRRFDAVFLTVVILNLFLNIDFATLVRDVKIKTFVVVEFEFSLPACQTEILLLKNFKTV